MPSKERDLAAVRRRQPRPVAVGDMYEYAYDFYQVNAVGHTAAGTTKVTLRKVQHTHTTLAPSYHIHPSTLQ